ncbi:MAG: hypothetical protein ABIE74_07700, partial [Pseudomonadota bacterium]
MKLVGHRGFTSTISGQNNSRSPIEIQASVAEAFTLSSFHSARDRDLDKLGVERYFKVCRTIGDLMYEVRGESDIDKVKGEINGLIWNDFDYRISAVGKWALNVLSGLIAIEEPVTEPKIKSKSKHGKPANEKRSLRYLSDLVDVEEVETELDDCRMGSRRNKKVNTKREAKKLSISIAGCLESNATLEKKLEYLRTLIDSNEKIINPVHVAIVMHRLGKITKEEINIEKNRENLEEILEKLTNLIELIDEGFGAQEIGNALYGLQNLDAGVVPRELLLALSRKIDESGAMLDGQAIGNALYGLQSLDTGVVPRELLLALSRKIDESGAILDAQAIGNALYGLQSLDTGVV